MDEERRLLYVAITRAKKNLRISWCRSRRLYGDVKICNRSPFLEEIPKTDSVWLNKYDEKMSSFQFERSQVSRPTNSYRKNNGNSFARSSFGSVGDTLFSARKNRGVESNPWNLNAGDKVCHKKFGNGVVLRLTNAQSTDVATAWVDFRGQKKELLLKLAKLEKIS